jgi:hypothetical protein
MLQRRLGIQEKHSIQSRARLTVVIANLQRRPVPQTPCFADHFPEEFSGSS